MKKFPRTFFVISVVFLLGSLYFTDSPRFTNLGSMVLEDGTVIEDGVVIEDGPIMQIISACGDFICDGNNSEDKTTCPQDCGAVICGDSICESDENQSTCTPDCGGIVTMCEGDNCNITVETVPIEPVPTILPPIIQETVLTEEPSSSSPTVLNSAPTPPATNTGSTSASIAQPVSNSSTLNNGILNINGIIDRYGVSEADIQKEIFKAINGDKVGDLVTWPTVSVLKYYCSYDYYWVSKYIPSGTKPYAQRFNDWIATRDDSKPDPLASWCQQVCPGGMQASTEGLKLATKDPTAKVCRSKMCPGDNDFLTKWGCIRNEKNPVSPPLPPVREYCGDKIVQKNEQCDDGNIANNDGCSYVCKNEICGDTIVQSPEQCDDGNTNNYDACLGGLGHPLACKNAKCGDGYIWASREYCDPKDGKIEPGKPDCEPTTCQKAKCGDKIIQESRGEQCDLGPFNNDLGPCTFECKLNICGDGKTNFAVEECDDKNKQDEDGCSSTCKIEKCGDGKVQGKMGEQCDDGNSTPGDGCFACKKEAAPCSDGNNQKGCICDDAYTQKKVNETISLMMDKKADKNILLNKIQELPKDCLEKYLCKQTVPINTSCGMPVTKNEAVAQSQILLYSKDFLKPAGLDALYRPWNELFSGGPTGATLDTTKMKTRDALLDYAGTVDKLKKIPKECPMMESFIRDYLVHDYDPFSPKRLKMTQMSLYLAGSYAGQIDGQVVSTNDALKKRFKWSSDRFGFPYLQGQDYEIGGVGTIFGLNPDGSIDTDDNGLGNGFMNPANIDYNTRDPNLRGASLPLPVLVHELCPDVKADIANYFKIGDDTMKSNIQKAEQRAREKIAEITSNKTPTRTKNSQIKQVNRSLSQEKAQIQSKNAKNKDCQAMMTAVKYWDPHTSEVTTQVILQNCLNYLDTQNASTCKQRLRAATLHIRVADQTIPVPVKLVDIGPRRSIWDREKRPTIDLTYGANKELMAMIDESPKGKIYDICFYID